MPIRKSLLIVMVSIRSPRSVLSSQRMETVVREGIARSMIVHEYQQGDHLVRVQYGIPNRFYPSVIKNYDIVLDIDVYSGGQQSIDTWEESITQFNHQAYNMFISYIKESFLNTLK